MTCTKLCITHFIKTLVNTNNFSFFATSKFPFDAVDVDAGSSSTARADVTVLLVHEYGRRIAAAAISEMFVGTSTMMQM